MPAQPLLVQMGPRIMDDRLPPPMQKRIYRDDALPRDSLGVDLPMSKNIKGWQAYTPKNRARSPSTVKKADANQPMSWSDGRLENIRKGENG